MIKNLTTLAVALMAVSAFSIGWPLPPKAQTSCCDVKVCCKDASAACKKACETVASCKKGCKDGTCESCCSNCCGAK